MDEENYYLKKVAEEYRSCVATCGLKQLDFGITFKRIHRDGKVIESAIDHCILNKPELINDYFKINVDYSPDHSGIIMDTQIGIPKNHKGQTLLRRDLRKIRQFYDIDTIYCR